MHYMVAPTNVRFAEPTQESLTQYVHRTGQTKSSVINTAVDEWLHMQDHRRIGFVSIETGERRAASCRRPAGVDDRGGLAGTRTGRQESVGGERRRQGSRHAGRGGSALLGRSSQRS